MSESLERLRGSLKILIDIVIEMGELFDIFDRKSKGMADF